MKNVVLDLPTFGIIVATRVALGFGISLLMADSDEHAAALDC
jgi:hypothetical protein